MAVSRNPSLYMARKRFWTLQGSVPRFSPCQMRIHRYVTGNTIEKATIAEGNPAPDRAVIKPWPPTSAASETDT